MPSDQTSFDIDDELTVDQNLEAFVRHLKVIDEPLADCLSAVIQNMSLDTEELPKGDILRDLFNATALKDDAAAPSGEGD